VKPARTAPRGAGAGLPADDDAQAEEDGEESSEEDAELEDGLDGMDMDGDDEEARARRPKAKYMKMFVSLLRGRYREWSWRADSRSCRSRLQIGN